MPIVPKNKTEGESMLLKQDCFVRREFQLFIADRNNYNHDRKF